MRFIPQWKTTFQDKDRNPQSVCDISFNFDGSQLLVASGNHILVYETNSYSLVSTLKGHKDKINCICSAPNGQRFASGSCDKTTIIWSKKLEGSLKYNHNDAVQCLSFNPLSNHLVSCAVTDFAFWSPEDKSVQKHKIYAKINSCSWTSDGQYLALGLNNGIVSIRNKIAEEVSKIERDNSSIWALAWNPYRIDDTDVLCVTNWNKILSFYTFTGTVVGKERDLGFEALKVVYFPNGNFFLACGMNKSCVMHTHDGIKLDIIGEPQTSWVTCCAVHPSGQFVAMGSESGVVTFYQVIFNTVHSLYKERYAFRENMTDIIIQHLVNEKKVRIKCKSLIKKIAIYKHRLAVQLMDRVIIYELYTNDGNDMYYKAKEKITRKLFCSLLVVCANHVILCQEKKLKSMYITGQDDKEWIFDSTIRYIKTVGGPIGKEMLLVGLENGQVYQLCLDSAHVTLKVNVKSAVRYLDYSQKKKKIAVVDEKGILQVFSAISGDLLLQEYDVSSAVFNNLYEDMIVFSGVNYMCTQIVDFTPHRHQFSGCVIGLYGTKVFYLNGSTIATLEISLSAQMFQYIEKNMYQQAFEIACLGVTLGDWEDLAFSSLKHLDLEIARLAFIKLKNFLFLDLIEDLKQMEMKDSTPKDVLLADILAYKGDLKEAARLYQKAGYTHKTLTMYTDMRMFDLAQEYLGTSDNTELVRQKADWAKSINEPKVAADIYMSIGDIQSAVDIYGELGWTDQLVEISRQLNDNQRPILFDIANHLKRLNELQQAAIIFTKLGENNSVLLLHIECQQWTEAFKLIQNQPQYTNLVYTHYADWLSDNNNFLQAQKAYYQAGKPEKAFTVLNQLIKNSIDECSFKEAGYFYWIMARHQFELAKKSDENVEGIIIKSNECDKLATVYYCYQAVHNYLEEPFTSFLPDALLNISRYLLTEVKASIPQGISLFAILYCLFKQASKLGINKLVKDVLDNIQTLIIPPKFQEQIEIAMVTARTRQYRNPEEYLPMCYNCSTYNPILSSSNRCVNCGHPFVFSYINFDILPLVEFELDDGIDDMDAIKYIEASVIEDKSTVSLETNIQTLTLNNSSESKSFSSDNNSVNIFEPVRSSKEDLLSMDSSTVTIVKHSAPLKYKYFKNLIPDLQTTVCTVCFKIFHTDDYEMQLLQKGHCPYCRTSTEKLHQNKGIREST